MATFNYYSPIINSQPVNLSNVGSLSDRSILPIVTVLFKKIPDNSTMYRTWTGLLYKLHYTICIQYHTKHYYGRIANNHLGISTSLSIVDHTICKVSPLTMACYVPVTWMTNAHT